MKPIRLMAGFFTVGIWTLLSRLMGFVRDIMIASYLGTGPVAEAFLVAFSLPNLFRRFFAEGAFNMAFVPMFSKKVEADEGALKFAQDAFVGMTFILTIFTVLGIIFMPLLVTAMASGFIGDSRFDLSVYYGRIAFPYILFISLSALLSGVLNATGRFMAAAAAPVFLNIIFIGFMIFAAVLWSLSETAGQEMENALHNHFGEWLSIAVPVGGVVQMAIVWIAAARAGFPMKLARPKMTPELK
ncbi:MAG: lipid II flippase MurJ, partial [Loktanella sp.]|nr:lipid II flippase MurJ [Loktanella sp.]